MHIFKKSVMSLATPLLLSSLAHAFVIEDTETVKLHLYGEMSVFSQLTSEDNKVTPKGSFSEFKYGFRGNFKVSEILSIYVRNEWKHIEPDDTYDHRYIYLGFDFKPYHFKFDYGRNSGVVKLFSGYTDQFATFGGDTAGSTYRGKYVLNRRTSKLFTFYTNDFFGLIKGAHIVLQYAGKSKETLNTNAYGIKIDYKIPNTDFTMGTVYSKLEGNKAKTWGIAGNYQKNDWYLGALYIRGKQKNDPSTYQGMEFVIKKKFELAPIQVEPSIGYIRHKTKQVGLSAHYLSVGSNIYLIKNLKVSVGAKINLLKNSRPKRDNANTYYLGFVYNF